MLWKITTSNRALIENRSNSPAIDDGPAGLLGQQDVDEQPDAASQPDDIEAGRLRRLGQRARGVPAEHVERIDVMDHGHVMPACGERPREPLHGDAIAAEVDTADRTWSESEAQGIQRRGRSPAVRQCAACALRAQLNSPARSRARRPIARLRRLVDPAARQRRRERAFIARRDEQPPPASSSAAGWRSWR